MNQLVFVFVVEMPWIYALRRKKENEQRQQSKLIGTILQSQSFFFLSQHDM